MTIDPARVHELFKNCLFREEEMVGLKPGEIPPNAVIVEAIVRKFGFHQQRLMSHRDEVFDMLDQLPDQFHDVSDKHTNGGGGWSFLQAVTDRDDNHWGEQSTAEALLALGQGLNRVEIMMREMASMMPGGVPYIRIKAP